MEWFDLHGIMILVESRTQLQSMIVLIVAPLL